MTVVTLEPWEYHWAEHVGTQRDEINRTKLMATTGMSTYDQGFVNTSSTTSAITYIDGEAGVSLLKTFFFIKIFKKQDSPLHE